MEEDIIVKKIKPMYTRILLTKNEYTEAGLIASTGLIDATKIKQGIKEYQKVIAVGPQVREVKVGDLVCIDPSRYAIRKYSKQETKEAMDEFYNATVKYAFPEVTIDGKNYLYLDERDIDFIIEEYTETKNQ